MNSNQITECIMLGLALTAGCVLAGLGHTELATVVVSGAVGWMSKSVPPPVS